MFQMLLRITAAVFLVDMITSMYPTEYAIFRKGPAYSVGSRNNVTWFKRGGMTYSTREGVGTPSLVETLPKITYSNL